MQYIKDNAIHKRHTPGDGPRKQHVPYLTELLKLAMRIPRLRMRSRVVSWGCRPPASSCWRASCCTSVHAAAEALRRSKAATSLHVQSHQHQRLGSAHWAAF